MVSYRTLDPNGFTARAKRSRRGNRADNNRASIRPAAVPKDPRKRLKYSILLSGPALEQDLSKEEADFRRHITSTGPVQITTFSSMSYKSTDHLRAQHNIYGKYLRLIFHSERGAKKGLSILLGDDEVAGIIPLSGKTIEARPCVSEVNVLTGVENCLCSARKLAADIMDLEGAFGSLAVESCDVVMEEEMQTQHFEPERELDVVLELLNKWGVSEEADCEML